MLIVNRKKGFFFFSGNHQQTESSNIMQAQHRFTLNAIAHELLTMKTLSSIQYNKKRLVSLQCNNNINMKFVMKR